MEMSFSHLKQKAVSVPVRTGSHLVPTKQTDLKIPRNGGEYLERVWWGP